MGSNIIASCMACASFARSENFGQAGEFINMHPEIIWYITCSALGGYFSVSSILLLIKHFSPTYAECVKGCRKVLSIGASYVLFPSPNKILNTYHFSGVILLVLSIMTTIYNKQQKKAKKDYQRSAYNLLPQTDDK